MINLKSVEDLLFLSYLTNYNVSEIHKYINNSNPIKFDKEFTINNNGKLVDEVANTTKIALEKLKYYNIEAIPYHSKKYPKQLKLIKDFPPILYVRGKLKTNKLVAIVGSRKSSLIAERKVLEITKVFISKKYGIVSGLAIGIDTYAHNSTIEQLGYTIAVMPTSLDLIYPLENYGLANNILNKGGALVSEIPIGINRGKKSFIDRNRIQTAFCEFVIPIEMGTNSGTMHTVNFCIQQNKNLLLPIPSATTQINYKEYYDGIVYLENKYKLKPLNNVFFFHNIDELKSLIVTKKKNSIEKVSIQTDIKF